MRSVGVSLCKSLCKFSVIRQFLSARQQCVSVDGGVSNYVDVVSGVSQGSVLGPLLFILYTADLFSIVDNLLVGYADDATLNSVAQRPANGVSVSNSLQCDTDTISNWCSRWGMCLNVDKTKTTTISRSRTVLPSFPELMLNSVVLKESSELIITDVTFDP